MKEIKAVICDIDGTIRRKGEKDLSPATKDVLQRLHDHGVMLGIASGRSIERELLYCAETWGFDFQFDLLIGENGAEYYDHFTQKLEVLHVLKKEWIKEIIESLQPFDLNPAMYSHKEKILLFAIYCTSYLQSNIEMLRLLQEKEIENRVYLLIHQIDYSSLKINLIFLILHFQDCLFLLLL